tara:strand:- start:3793 stop:3981 length:189 start_codon:yes stop_codon:yes gene_type:complete
MGIRGIAPFVKEGIRLIKKEDLIIILGQVKDTGEDLFSFPNVFGHDHGEVYAVHVHAAGFPK